MTDVEDQLAQHLARKAAQATPRSDLDAVTAQPALIVRLAPITRTRAKWRGRLVAAAAATAIAAMAVIVMRDSSEPTTPAVAPDSACTVFMRPDVGEEQTAAIGEQLRQQAEVTNLFEVTKQQAYLEFLQLFGDREDLARSVTADVLPTRWEFDLSPDTDTVRARISSLFAGDPSIAQARCLDPVTQEPITVGATLTSSGTATPQRTPCVTWVANTALCVGGGTR